MRSSVGDMGNRLRFKEELWICLEEDFYPLMIYRRQAKLLEIMGQWDITEEIHRNNRDWLKKHGQILQEAISLMHHGRVIYRRDRVREALDLLMEAERLMAGYQGIERCDLLNNMGNVHYRLGNYREAESCLLKSLELSRRHGWLTDEANALNNLGNIYGDQGELEKALEYYWQSYRIGEEIGDFYNNSMTAGNIAWCYLHQGKYQEAMKWYQNQIEVSQKIGDKYLISVALGNMTALLIEFREYQKAVEYATRRLDIAHSLGDSRGLSISYSHLGTIEYLEGDYQRAEEYYQRAITIARKLDSKYFLCLYLYEISQMHYKMLDRQTSRQECMEAFLLAREMNLPKYIIKTSLFLSRLSDGPEEALDFLRPLEGRKLEGEDLAWLNVELFRHTGQERYRRAALECGRDLEENLEGEELRLALEALDGQKGRA